MYAKYVWSLDGLNEARSCVDADHNTVAVLSRGIEDATPRVPPAL